jgi:hypothetical protein
MHKHAITVSSRDDGGLAFLQSPQQSYWPKQDGSSYSGNGNGSAFAIAELTLGEARRNPIAICRLHILHCPFKLARLAPTSGFFGSGNPCTSGSIPFENSDPINLYVSHYSEIDNITDLRFLSGKRILQLNFHLSTVGHGDFGFRDRNGGH